MRLRAHGKDQNRPNPGSRSKELVAYPHIQVLVVPTVQYIPTLTTQTQKRDLGRYSTYIPR